jgi:hypothetical protein
MGVQMKIEQPVSEKIAGAAPEGQICAFEAPAAHR